MKNRFWWANDLSLIRFELHPLIHTGLWYYLCSLWCLQLRLYSNIIDDLIDDCLLVSSEGAIWRSKELLCFLFHLQMKELDVGFVAFDCLLQKVELKVFLWVLGLEFHQVLGGCLLLDLL